MGDQSHLTSAEIGEAIKAFVPAQQYLLLGKANIFALGIRMRGEELLQEACTLALSGHRKCPRDVKVVTFLINVMRSVSSHALESLACDSPVFDDGINIDATVSAGEEWNAEAEVAAARVLEQIKEKFGNEDIVMGILESRYDGWNKAESCEMLGISQQEYDAAVKRLRRFTETEIGRDL